jgi:hypothetical protein
MPEQSKRNRKRGHRDMEPAAIPTRPPGERRRMRSYGRVIQQAKTTNE